MAGGIEGAFMMAPYGEMMLQGLAKTASRDFWSGGRYTRALNRWKKAAKDYTGSTGYSNAQSQAMGTAMDTMRARQAEMRGDQMARGLTPAQAVAEGAAEMERTPMDQYEAMKMLGRANVEGKGKLVGEELEQAKNNSENVMNAVKSMGESISQIAPLAGMIGNKGGKTEQRDVTKSDASKWNNVDEDALREASEAQNYALGY